jgi:polyketide cyclase/dehydrase/lipid transport protein
MTTSPMPQAGPAPAAADSHPEPVRTVDTAGCFDHSWRETRIIDRPVDRVYEALLQVAEWPLLLPHVQQIDVTYDDGQYQEFWMTVASQSGGPSVRVRSIRNCRFPQIEYFQPEPPRFLRHHAGIWRLAPHGDSAEPPACRVEVIHLWNLEPGTAAEMYPTDDGRSTAQRVEEVLASHARLTLSSWQSALSHGGMD